MADKFTKITAKLRDIQRSLKNITGPLLILEHAPGDTDDYLTIAEIKSGGWSLVTTREGMELVINQTQEATPELLKRLTNVAHDGAVFKIVGTDKTMPKGAPLEWRWPVRPTGERYP